MLLCNFFHLTPYVMLSVLPVAVLCIPSRVGTVPAMFIAFATGLLVDLLAEGVVGLNTFALVPVAFVRQGLCRFIFGDELQERGEDFSVRKYGLGKVAFAVTLVQALFLVLYLWADGAGARPLLFNLVRFAASLVTGSVLGVIIAEVMVPVDRR